MTATVFLAALLGGWALAGLGIWVILRIEKQAIREMRELAEKALMSDKSYDGIKGAPLVPAASPDSPIEAFVREQDELQEMERILTEGKG